MPEVYSQLQQQYPLSPRKFWKKMFEGMGVYLILTMVIGLLVATGVYIGTTHVIPAVSSFFAVALVFGLLVLVPYSIYIKAYIRRYYYDINENFITIKKGVFAPSEIHVQFQKIQDVYVDQDLVDRLMGLYDVHIASATATSGMEAHIDGVDHAAAEGLKNLLLGKISSGSSNSSQPQAHAPQANVVKFEGTVSSVQYPVSSKWLIAKVFSSLGGIFVILLIVIGGNISKLSKVSETLVGFSIYAFIIIISSLGGIIYWAIWKHNFYFEFQPDYILIKTEVLNKEEKHVPYKTIQNVLIKQSLIDRIFGICTVNIENAAAGGVVTRGRAFQANNLVMIPGQTLDRGNQLVKIVNGITTPLSSTGTGL